VEDHADDARAVLDEFDVPAATVLGCRWGSTWPSSWRWRMAAECSACWLAGALPGHLRGGALRLAGRRRRRPERGAQRAGGAAPRVAGHTLPGPCSIPRFRSRSCGGCFRRPEPSRRPEVADVRAGGRLQRRVIGAARCRRRRNLIAGPLEHPLRPGLPPPARMPLDRRAPACGPGPGSPPVQ
jgi:hypothetical protein